MFPLFWLSLCFFVAMPRFWLLLLLLLFFLVGLCVCVYERPAARAPPSSTTHTQHIRMQTDLSRGDRGPLLRRLGLDGLPNLQRDATRLIDPAACQLLHQGLFVLLPDLWLREDEGLVDGAHHRARLLLLWVGGCGVRGMDALVDKMGMGSNVRTKVPSAKTL